MSHLLLVRVDAGAQGWGHLMRCLSVALAWRRRGHQASFLLHSGPFDSEISKRLRQGQFDFRFFVAESTAEEIQIVNHVIAQEDPFVVLLDGYRFDDDYETSLQLNEAKLAVFDDYGHAEHSSADFVINGNAHAKSKSANPSQQWKCGPRFLALRPEFSDACKQQSIDLQSSLNLLVMLGACPSNELVLLTMQTILELIAKRPNRFRQVDFVLGQRTLEQIPGLEELGHDHVHLVFHTNPSSLVGLMESADLAVSAAGSTLYELAATGVPTLAFAVAENQIAVLDALVEREIIWGCLPPLIDNGQSLKMVAEAAISAGRDEINARRQRGMSLVDGRGADRLAVSLEFEPIRLRPAAFTDLIPLFELRNEQEVRNNSVNQSLVTYEQHEHWLASKLNDDCCRLFVVVSRNNLVVGQVRFDLTPESKGVVISVSLAPEIRGLGLAGAILEESISQARGELDFDEVFALIRESNIPSQKAFEKCGFRDVGAEKINGIPYRQLSLLMRRPALN
jgi:UDP-2,4-diacetamido-2,4,6-trideoxy-beta-L-altropyranose hydrolase